jgi:putative ABC transport system substrate-binding protein
VRRLVELGWMDGRNIAIEIHYEVTSERWSEVLTDFVRSKVDVIVTHGTEPVLVAKQATSEIPIVAAIMADPIGSGLIAGLARPGGNVTGLSAESTDLAGQRVALLREIVPRLHTVAVLGYVENSTVVLEMREAEAAARKLGLEAISLEIRRAQDIAPAILSIGGRAEALYISADRFAMTNRTSIIVSAAALRLPTIYLTREAVEAGCLMSYGPDFPDLFRRAAEDVDKILRGTKPSDIPVQQPTKFDLVVNLNTAQAIGLTIPESFLARADELIE